MPEYTGPELCALSAVDAVAALKAGDVSPTEMLEAALTRIADVEPKINALPTICADRARSHIANLEEGDEGPWLAGLPLAIKDLTEVEGVRTTFGSPGFADHVPAASTPMVRRLEARGGVVIGKSNTPEMGAGGNTFNPVLGRTLNPWNTALNPGGSSGGAAASLAAGEVWLAHGSDLGGSLRTPAAYCGVVGLRPTPGRAGGGGKDNAFNYEAVQGPMARTVEDCALFLDAMAGYSVREPISLPAPTKSFHQAVLEAEAPKRIAYAPDMGGFAPVEAEVRALMDAAMKAMESTGTAIEEVATPTEGLDKAYRTLRALIWAAGPGSESEEITKHFKATLSENIAMTTDMNGWDVVAATRTRSALLQKMCDLFETYDAIACPVVGIAAQPTEVEFPTEVAGQPTPDYMDWLKFSFLASTTALPAISVPIGHTANGGAMGIQLIGKPQGDAGLLQVARVLEAQIAGFGRPIDPMS